MTAPNNEPIFCLTPVIGVAQLSSANTARDGTGDIVAVLTGGENGTRITRITIQATQTTSAGMIRLFLTIGAVTALYDEIAVTAITGSNTLAEFTATMEYAEDRALILPDGVVLSAATSIAQTFNVFAEGGLY
jgi:hypothetical protein